jgi:phage protein U
VAPGPYQIQVFTASGKPVNGLFGVFIVQGPFIQLSDTASIGQVASGPTGSEVIIKGAFFPLSDTTCTISTTSNGNFIAPNTAACSVFAGSGLFAGFNNVTGSFIVGNVNTGQYVIRVTGTAGGRDFAEAVFRKGDGLRLRHF